MGWLSQTAFLLCPPKALCTTVKLKETGTHLSNLSGIHSILEALRTGTAIERVMVAKGSGGPRVQEIIDLCRDLRIPVRFEPRATLDRNSQSSAHQGVVAVTGAYHYATLESVTRNAEMLVVLDGVEDPHNLGAIVRSAHAAGVTAILVPERRAAPMNDAASKAAAGALSHLPVIKIGNVTRTLQDLKEQGFWIYGLDERGQHNYDTVEYIAPSVLVVGGEGHGIHQLVARHCDFLVKIPLAGQISSLNVSVATGIALFDWKRRRIVK